jgi:mono-ADP-ribosyltransferase sirtuin 6
MEYFRDFDVGGMSFQKTGRKCEKCQGDLCDTLLDWEDALPETDFERATEECEKADLALCLGTSLRIEPAGSLPELAKKYVIVNLQETPKDEQAAMVSNWAIPIGTTENRRQSKDCGKRRVCPR